MQRARAPRRRAGAARPTVHAAAGRDIARGRAGPDRVAHPPARKYPPQALQQSRIQCAGSISRNAPR